MTVPTLDDDEFKRLRTLIQSWCGIALEDSKKYLVESRLRDVVLETGCASYGDFYQKACAGDVSLRDRIIDDMTTNETSWFRDGPFWKTVREVIIPEAIAVARAEGRLASALELGHHRDHEAVVGAVVDDLDRGHAADAHAAKDHWRADLQAVDRTAEVHHRALLAFEQIVAGNEDDRRGEQRQAGDNEGADQGGAGFA